MLSGEGVVVWCLAESEKFCDVWRRGRVFVVLEVMRVGVLFSSEGQVVWC